MSKVEEEGGGENTGEVLRCIYVVMYKWASIIRQVLISRYTLLSIELRKKRRQEGIT